MVKEEEDHLVVAVLGRQVEGGRLAAVHGVDGGVVLRGGGT